MKQPNSLLKTAVILSALLLVGAFVSCRAGAPWFKKASTQPDESGSKAASEESSPGSDASPQASSEDTQENRAVLGGSKSATVMSSSKSGAILQESGLDSSVWDLDTSLLSDSDESPAPETTPETTDTQPSPPPL